MIVASIILELLVVDIVDRDAIEKKANANEGEKLLARFTPAHIYTVEQFLIFRNIT